MKDEVGRGTPAAILLVFGHYEAHPNNSTNAQMRGRPPAATFNTSNSHTRMHEEREMHGEPGAAAEREREREKERARERERT